MSNDELEVPDIYREDNMDREYDYNREDDVYRENWNRDIEDKEYDRLR